MGLQVQATKIRTYTNLFIGVTSMFGSFSILVGMGMGFYGQELNNIATARKYGVEIVEGTYDVPDGDVVHYRACLPKNRPEGARYPGVLFAPGIDINWEHWTPWCVALAHHDYITLMKDRPGDRPIENTQEIEAGLAFMRSVPEIDPTRVALGGSSYGHREVMNYILEHPDDIPGYFNISGYNDPQKMQTAGSFETHTAQVLVMSGGGEDLGGDCDQQGFEWTSEFTQKLLDERSESLWYRKVFDAETYGCTPHGYMWDPRHPATAESAKLILQFLEEIIGQGPTL
ncbi:MAG: hypothetical protein HYV34_04050 [Candidatus Kerfeldbacteria bacterium]|nr:hypothetical protein [Candidatus Kerfeldbacteria bacterium]